MSSSSSSSMTYRLILSKSFFFDAYDPALKPPLALILLLKRALLASDTVRLFSSSSLKSAISTTTSSGWSWITEWRKDRAPPKSVSTTMFSKLISVFADWRASLYFLAIKIILSVYQMHHMTINPSSPASSKPFIAPVLLKRERAKTKLHTQTTMASKIFHHLILPLAGSLAYFLQPTNLIRHPKSIPISMFKTNSSTIKRGDSDTWKPSKMVTKIRPKLRTSSPM